MERQALLAEDYPRVGDGTRDFSGRSKQALAPARVGHGRQYQPPDARLHYLLRFRPLDGTGHRLHDNRQPLADNVRAEARHCKPIAPPSISLRQTMTLLYRSAAPEDIAACIEIRGKTRENSVSVERLRTLGVTRESWSAGVADGSLPGHVCLAEGRIVGYCFGARDTGEIVVLALLPDWEAKGIGKCLLSMVVADLMQLGFQRLFLGCSSNPEVRSYGFYRHLGWRSTGTLDAHRDEVLEYFPNQIARTSCL